jgi:hypothetical protein
MEVLLSLCLLAALAAVSVLAVGGWRQEAAFEEGVDRFESALRLARAESARLGLRMRLAFGEDGSVGILYEPQPLEAPGEFVDYIGCTWRDVVGGDLFRVSRCELTGSSAWRPASQGEILPGSDAVPLEALTFYPDGTSDSALVELRPAEDDDPRRAVVEVGGAPGEITTRLALADALPEVYEDIRLAQFPEGSEGG